MNDPRSATLFKRRRAALAEQLLGSGIQILHCTTKLDNGVRVPILGKRLRSKETLAK